MRFDQQTYDRIIMRLALGGTVNGEEVPGNPNMLVPWFLMASYAYEIENDPFLSDGGYDWLCKELDAKWDTIEHRHKHLIDRGALSAGTALAADLANLPTIIKHAAKHLVSDYRSADQIAPRALPTADISDLLGEIATCNGDIAKATGIMDLLGGDPAPSITDLL